MAALCKKTAEGIEVFGLEADCTDESPDPIPKYDATSAKLLWPLVNIVICTSQTTTSVGWALTTAVLHETVTTSKDRSAVYHAPVHEGIVSTSAPATATLSSVLADDRLTKPATVSVSGLREHWS